MIDEDLVPIVAPVRITSIDLKVVLNAKNDGRFSPNARIRNVYSQIK